MAERPAAGKKAFIFDFEDDLMSEETATGNAGLKDYENAEAVVEWIYGKVPTVRGAHSCFILAEAGPKGFQITRAKKLHHPSGGGAAVVQK